MTIDPNTLLSLPIPDTSQSYTAKDSILYALGLGLGSDPTDTWQLRRVYEKDLQALPTMGVVLATPGLWVRDLDTGINWRRLVHGEQGLVLHRPLPASGRVIGRSRVVDVIDKGPGKGALVYSERIIVDADTGEALCTSTQTMFCRDDGGFGGATRTVQPAHAVPDRLPDEIHEIATLPQAALLYRLSGDMNPLHADPDVASVAGFDRPILHGLATFGMAACALLRALDMRDPRHHLKSIACRFTAPVFPGERLATSIWIDGSTVSFRVSVVDRDVVAINNGRAEFGLF